MILGGRQGGHRQETVAPARSAQHVDLFTLFALTGSLEELSDAFARRGHAEAAALVVSSPAVPAV